MTTVYLNGAFCPAEEAKVSVFDRGFLFGDGVYEVIPFYEGRGFGWEGHMQRFARSLAAIHIPNPLDEAGWRAIAKHLLEENGATQLMYFQVTRGNSNPRKQTYETPMTPTVYGNSFSFTPVATGGLSVITVSDDRWSHPHIKSLNLLANVLAMQAAKEKGAMEAILIRDSFVTEGAACNVFVVYQGEVLTTPTDGTILHGVTRGIILKMLSSLAIPAKEVPISMHTLQHADEIWVSSVGKEVTPVTQLNGHPVGTGKPGPMWERAFAAYQDCIRHDAHSL